MPDLAQCLSTKCARRARCARNEASGTKPSVQNYLVNSDQWDGDRCGWFWEADVAAPSVPKGPRIVPGDVVFHKPSGETWVVAAADPETDQLMWCGWPEGVARLSDCELQQAATLEESLGTHRRLEGARRSMADRVYGPPVEARDGAA